MTDSGDGAGEGNSDGNATVLVVDDEEDLAELYTMLLSSEYDVRTATSGAEALRELDESVDVVLLDRRMPDMSGDEVLCEIRERSPTVQVAMLTAVEPDADIVDLPFDDYRVKPVGKSDLLGLVGTLIKRTTYDERSREFFRLASKKAALEIAGNDGTEEYGQIAERMAVVREDVDATLDELSDTAVFGDLANDGEGN